MLFADEIFWKAPNVYDVFGVVGVIAGIFSIWYAWLLSKRDIRKRIDEAAERASRAAREEVRRVARAVLQTGITEAIRTLAIAREACRSKSWVRAGELCELARDQLASVRDQLEGVLVQPTTISEVQSELQTVLAVLLDCMTQLGRKRQTGAGKMPDDVLRGLAESTHALRGVEGRIRGTGGEVDRG